MFDDLLHDAVEVVQPVAAPALRHRNNGRAGAHHGPAAIGRLQYSYVKNRVKQLEKQVALQHERQISRNM